MKNEEVKEILKKQGYRVATSITLRNLKKDDLIERIRTLEHNWAVAVERCENQYKLLMKKDIEEKKYSWHDLRNNPEDLPDSQRFVEVRTEDSFPCYFGWYDTESELGSWYDAVGFSMNPVKWREIEEEVEE